MNPKPEQATCMHQYQTSPGEPIVCTKCGKVDGAKPEQTKIQPVAYLCEREDRPLVIRRTLEEAGMELLYDYTVTPLVSITDHEAAVAKYKDGLRELIFQTNALAGRLISGPHTSNDARCIERTRELAAKLEELLS